MTEKKTPTEITPHTTLKLSLATWIGILSPLMLLAVGFARSVFVQEDNQEEIAKNRIEIKQFDEKIDTVLGRLEDIVRHDERIKAVEGRVDRLEGTK